MTELVLSWKDAGPVAAAFMRSKARVSVICGPIGSGKTSAALRKCAKPVWESAIPHPADGIARWRMIVLRATYRDLERSTLPSWHHWFPREIGDWTGGEGGRPAKHVITFDYLDKICELTAEFIGVGEHKIEDLARGLEPSCILVNEIDLMARDTLTHLLPRVGRFMGPDRSIGFPGNPEAFVVGDLNAPEIDNWVYTRFVDNLPLNWALFMQPGGLDPDAENLDNLPGGRDYYERLIASHPEWYVNRFVHNRFGFTRDGQPVYPEYHDGRHVARTELLPHKDLPLVIGLDAGFQPAAVLTQQHFTGQWRALDELAPTNTMATTFARRLQQLLASEKYRACNKIALYADPSAFNKSPTDEKSWCQVVSAVLGLPIKPAPTNNINPRVEAVRVTLTRPTDDPNDPFGFLLSPTCRKLRRGFNSGYHFRKIERVGSSEERHAPEPDKNEFSHPHDALQYALLGGGEYYVITGKAEKRKAAAEAMKGEIKRAADYDPLSW